MSDGLLHVVLSPHPTPEHEPTDAARASDQTDSATQGPPRDALATDEPEAERGGPGETGTAVEECDEMMSLLVSLGMSKYEAECRMSEVFSPSRVTTGAERHAGLNILAGTAFDLKMKSLTLLLPFVEVGGLLTWL